MSQIENVRYTNINWGPYVMKTSVPNYIIERLMQDGIKTKKNYNKKLAGHLKNQFLYPKETQHWFYTQIKPILQAYREGHCLYHGIKNLEVELGADDLWINFMKSGDFNPLHTHNCDYSFVLFLNVTKELIKEQDEFEGTSAPPGSLIFEYTQQAKPKWATTGAAIKPVTGDMFIFPALLQHWVCPFKSKTTRISVSGNIAILNRDKLPSDYF